MKFLLPLTLLVSLSLAQNIQTNYPYTAFTYASTVCSTCRTLVLKGREFYLPFCGRDGYGNEETVSYCEGLCEELNMAKGSCDKCEQACSNVFIPVCNAEDDVVYVNKCWAECAGEVDYQPCLRPKPIDEAVQPTPVGPEPVPEGSEDNGEPVVGPQPILPDPVQPVPLPAPVEGETPQNQLPEGAQEEGQAPVQPVPLPAPVEGQVPVQPVPLPAPVEGEAPQNQLPEGAQQEGQVPENQLPQSTTPERFLLLPRAFAIYPYQYFYPQIQG